MPTPQRKILQAHVHSKCARLKSYIQFLLFLHLLFFWFSAEHTCSAENQRKKRCRNRRNWIHILIHRPQHISRYIYTYRIHIYSCSSNCYSCLHAQDRSSKITYQQISLPHEDTAILLCAESNSRPSQYRRFSMENARSRYSRRPWLTC